MFKDVYGKEYDKAAKGKATPADKLGLGGRLWEAAREAKDAPGLTRVLGDKALPLLLGDPAGYPLAAGPPGGLTNSQSIGDKPAGEWTVVTRDLFEDDGGAAAAVSGIGIETDGEVHLDAVYLTKNGRLRDLRRVYTVLGAGRPKP